MKRELISIIIPIYNTQKYLSKCIDSILSQTYDHLEIILIDDGSTDESGKICDEYAKIDNRIRVAHKENGGLSDARNFGLSISCGQIVLFVDSDDWIESEMIEVLYTNMVQNNSDISICGFNFVINGNKLSKNRDMDVIVYDTYSAIEDMYKCKKFASHVWNKLIRKALFEGIEFPIGKIYEDQYITTSLILKSQTVCYTDRAFYNYVIRNESITQLKYSEKQLHLLYATENNISAVQSKYPDLSSYVKFNWVNHYIDLLTKAILDKQDISYFKKNKKKAKEYAWGFTTWEKCFSIKIRWYVIKSSITLYKYVFVPFERMLRILIKK